MRAEGQGRLEVVRWSVRDFTVDGNDVVKVIMRCMIRRTNE
jgi:hypothetical protein